MSQASGDGGADPDGGTGLTGAPYSTIVGGVSLTTTGRWRALAVGQHLGRQRRRH